MSVLGIDLGNANCRLAKAGRGGVDVLLNGSSKRLNSCTVSLQGKQRFMGDDAAAIARSNFKNTATNFKRLLGRQYREPEVQAELARMPGVAFEEMENGTVGIRVNYNDEVKVLAMEQCMAMMLTKLSAISQEATNTKPADVVISIPGWYTDEQRVAMLNACHIAQMSCLRLLHEGTAVALEYGMFKNAKGFFDAEKATHVLFVDFGQSSFSATIASFVAGKLHTKSAKYDRILGGRDFDELIGRKIADAFAAKHKDDPWPNTKARMKLLAAAERCKKTLSPPGVTEARINCECLMNDIDFNMTLKLDEFKEAAEPLLARMVPVLEGVITESGIDPADITTVEIVGGSTRLGFVKERVSQILHGLGVPINMTALNNGLSTTMNADEATARGTAWQAALLSTRFRVREYEIIDAITYPIKLDWPASVDVEPTSAMEDTDAAADEGGEKAEPSAMTGASALLFQKNGPTPNMKKVTFRRTGSFSITASYDDSAMPSLPEGQNPTIRVFHIEAPESSIEGNPPKIRVNVRHNVHGVVEVSSAQVMEEINEPPKTKQDSKTGDDQGDEKMGDNVDTKGSSGSEDTATSPEGKESEEKDANSVATEEPPKKKRFRKVDLKVTMDSTGMSTSALANALEAEAKMVHQDYVIEETNAAKNDVEAYIYSQRDTLIGDLRPFCTDNEKEEQETALTAAEDWLYYGDGYDAQKSAYVEKLRDLKKKGEKMVYRQLEATNRDACIRNLKAAIDDYKSWLVKSETEDNFSHISQEEKNIVRESCEAAESWIYAQLEAQGKLPQNVDPCFSCDDVNLQRKNMISACKPIMNKPKPQPPKPEPQAQDSQVEDNESSKADEAPSTNASETPSTSESSSAETPTPADDGMSEEKPEVPTEEKTEKLP